jgi:hypothetical protein
MRLADWSATSLMYGVRVWFQEAGALVFDDLGPFDRYFAELVCVDMAGGITRGGRWVHVQRAVIVPWAVPL